MAFGRKLTTWGVKLEPPERLKAIIRRLTGAVGIEVVRSGGSRWIADLGIKTVFDVGANVGQFSVEMRRLLPEAQVYAFEPLPSVCASLQKRFDGDERFRSFALALSDQPGTAQMNASAFSPSSSILRMDQLHQREFPFSTAHSKVAVAVSSLDMVAADLVTPAEVLVKIDVQGFEDKVIAGGRGVLVHAAIVIVEINHENLYHGQPSFDQIYGQLRALGFKFHGTWHQLFSRRTGAVLASDIIFVGRGAGEGAAGGA